MLPAFELPKEREARAPREALGLSRDGVSMLVTSGTTGSHEVARFTDLASYLREGDLLVVNDSATVAAALDARYPNGTRLRIHVSTRISERLWIVEPRNAPLLSVGERLALPDGGSVAIVAPLHREHRRLWYALLDLPQPAYAYLARHGRPIAYDYVDGSYPIEMYQTIFAREPGSVEMPSAGRPFTLRVVDSLCRAGVDLAAITLHCGVASPEAHEPPLDERFEVSARTARAVNAAHWRGGRVIAVGTTVVRALESATNERGKVRPASGWTSRIVDRSNPPKAVDGLLTGFHEPRASHLLMLETFASNDLLQQAYAKAVDSELLWHEFGDVHLLL